MNLKCLPQNSIQRSKELLNKGSLQFIHHDSHLWYMLIILSFFRELTEPECDHDYGAKKLSWLQQMMGHDLKSINSKSNDPDDIDNIENITGEQLQKELDQIIRDYKQKKQNTGQNHRKERNSDDKKFIISV